MIAEENEEKQVSVLTYGGTRLPSPENPPLSYEDRVRAVRERSSRNSRIAGSAAAWDNCPMSDCRYTVG